MKLFRRKNTPKGEKIYVENMEAILTRVFIDSNADPDVTLPYIQIRLIRGKHGRSDYEELEIMMPVKKASKLAQELINAIGAAMPTVPKSAKSIPWGE